MKRMYYKNVNTMLLLLYFINTLMTITNITICKGGRKVNQDIRAYAKQKNVKHWQIAEALGMTDTNFSRKLRHELPPDEKRKIMEVIDNLAVNCA